MPVIVCGVGGPSGSGKSTLTKKLAVTLEQRGFNVHVVPEDPKYFLFPFQPDYTKRDPLTETPVNIDWPQLCQDVQLRTKDAQKEGNGVVLVENFLLLANTNLLHLLDLALILTGVEQEECRKRRVNRQQRKAEEAKALSAYYDDHVWPSYQRYTLSVAQELLAKKRVNAPQGGDRASNHVSHGTPSVNPFVQLLNAKVGPEALVEEAVQCILPWLGKC
mmetsp:Transcript_119149/g.207396  ORF Transcript_119149/g.207396 Transcript_119149/m.207396 type:complete len:219 (-) Transcript_119149:204-860(-)